MEPVEDPAQAWNALTVGAFTELVDVGATGTSHEGWTAVAPPGDLSPFSRTGVAFQTQWPVKPEVVLEGGNAAVSPSGTDFDWPDSLQILTTASNHSGRLLSTTNATSAATAGAAYMASCIAAEYPTFWPETIRGLVVHSAEWTEQMRTHIASAGNRRRDRANYVRRYGYGVPSLDRALRSVSQVTDSDCSGHDSPFRSWKPPRNAPATYLPWPRDVLSDLGEVQVKMKVTLVLH